MNIFEENRYLMLRKIQKEINPKVAVEIGVQKGIYAKEMFKAFLNAQIILIDPWKEFTKEEYLDTGNILQGLQDLNLEETKENTNEWKNRRQIIRKESLEIINEINDNSIDFIYLDGNHAYKYVKQELRQFWKKIKKGGYLAGHDYLNMNTYELKIGVKKAVDEFVKDYKLKLQTTNEEKWKSWIIKKC